MQTYSTIHRVDHSAAEMFALVADIERYPEFVPLCQGTRVYQRKERDDGTVVLLSEMTVAYKLFHETFTTRVTLDRSACKVLVEYVDGPLRQLQNRWEFTEAGEGACDVHFYVAYEFASRTLQLVVGAVFDRAFRKFVTAFETRAGQVYGRVPKMQAALR